jgi:hypothetical protein
MHARRSLVVHGGAISTATSVLLARESGRVLLSHVCLSVRMRVRCVMHGVLGHG